MLAACLIDLDCAFQLATFHGNQSSIADPLADHEHNTLPTFNLLERARGTAGWRSSSTPAAGCTVAEKTFDGAKATTEDAPVSLWLDSPYQISKIVGEYLLQLLLQPPRPARGQGPLSERLWPRRGARRRPVARHPATVWRNVTPTFVYKALKHEALPVENGGIATRDFIFVEDIGAGPDRVRRSTATPGEIYNLASGVETSILELAELINELTGNPTPIALTRRATGTARASATASRPRPASSSGFAAEVAAARWARADGRMDPPERRLDPALHGPARGPPRRRGGASRRAG